MIFFGGADNQDAADSSDIAVVTDSVNVYDTLTNSWSSLPPLNTPRMWATGQLYRGYYFILGGLNSQSNQLSVAEILAR